MTRTLRRSAALVAALTLCSTNAAASPAPDTARDEASPERGAREEAPPAAEGDAAIDPQQLFRAGEEAYWLGDFDLAIERFEAAYAASRVPGMLYNVGLAYYRRSEVSRSLADLERARVVFTNYLQADVGGLVAPAHVQGLIDEITGKIAALRAIEAPASEPASATPSGPEAPACDELPPPPDRGRRQRAIGGALLGLGAVGLTGGVVSTIAFSLKGAEFGDTLALLERQRSEAGCATPAQGQLCEDLDASVAITERNGHKANLLTATVGGSLLAVGAGLTIAGAALFARSRRGQPQRERGLTVAPTWGGVTVVGRF